MVTLLLEIFSQIYIRGNKLVLWRKKYSANSSARLQTIPATAKWIFVTPAVAVQLFETGIIGLDAINSSIAYKSFPLFHPDKKKCRVIFVTINIDNKQYALGICDTKIGGDTVKYYDADKMLLRTDLFQSNL